MENTEKEVKKISEYYLRESERVKNSSQKISIM